MKAPPFEHVVARSLDEAVAALAPPGAKVIAGGQSLGPMLNLRLARPTRLVDVGRLPGVRDTRERDGVIVYGACVTHAAIEDGAVPDAAAGGLREVAGGIAYRAVRNRGTIGGSLAHADPAADWPTALAALGASVEIAAASGQRSLSVEAISIGAFESALGADEVLTAVVVPKVGQGARFGFWKFCRKVGEYAEAMAAVLIDERRGVVRLAIGATEGKPIVIANAGSVIDDAEQAEPMLTAAGLAADPVTHRLHKAAIRRAIARAKAA